MSIKKRRKETTESVRDDWVPAADTGEEPGRDKDDAKLNEGVDYDDEHPTGDDTG